MKVIDYVKFVGVFIAVLVMAYSFVTVDWLSHFERQLAADMKPTVPDLHIMNRLAVRAHDIKYSDRPEYQVHVGWLAAPDENP